MIKNEDIFGMTYYEYGQAFFGSAGKMRYRIARNPLEKVFFLPPEKKAEGTFLVTVWFGDYSYTATKDEDKISREFPFTKEGQDEVLKWLNEQLEKVNGQSEQR